MTQPSPRPTVTPEDAARADGVLRAWSMDWHGVATIPPGDLQFLRGLLIAAFADCRHDAYADALADHTAASSDPDLDRCIHGRYRIDPCLSCGRRYEAGTAVGGFDRG